MLELTARHADAWNLAWFGLPDERLARVRGELLEACERVGRDRRRSPSRIGITVRYPGAPRDAEGRGARPARPAEVAAGLARTHAAGRRPRDRVLEPTTRETLAAFVEAVALYRARA